MGESLRKVGLMRQSGYCRVSRQLWRDPAFKAVRKKSRDAGELLIYLATCPHSNLLGFYHLPLAYAAADLGWTVARVRKAFGVIEEVELAEYDQKTSVVFVPWVLEWQEVQNRSQAKGAVKQLNNLPRTDLTEKLRKKLAPHFARQSKDGDRYMEPLAEWFGETEGDTVSTQSLDCVGTVGTTEAVTEAVTETETETEAVTESVTVPVRATNGESSHNHLLAIKNILGGPPQTTPEKFTDRVLRLTGEFHLRDMWLEKFRCAPEGAVISAVEEFERAVKAQQIANPAAYFNTIFQRHVSFRLPPAEEVQT